MLSNSEPTVILWPVFEIRFGYSPHSLPNTHKIIGLKVIETGMNINRGCGERRKNSSFLTLLLAFQDCFVSIA